jgi:UDP-3-O-[3-hydroxymyristoyl] N-acetylglucosamine deacetylase/3-hydroxyacyl-[acyl-carrier-protein] dehydratase
MKQRTICSEISIRGVGLHSGIESNVHILPAAANYGYRFVRTDLEKDTEVIADPSRVISTNRGTSLRQGEIEIHTVEHLLSALYGMGVDNARIEIDGPEVPILDGSAHEFAQKIKSAGLEEQNEDREVFVVDEPIQYFDKDQGAEIFAFPSDRFELTTLIDFDSEIVGSQYAQISGIAEYDKEVAPSRTFVFVRDLEQLMDMGLIKGGSLENAVVIADRKIENSTLERLSDRLEHRDVAVTEKGILNTNELRYPNEPARHKLLDVLGDLALFGKRIQGRIVAKKPGHKVNVAFAKKLKQKYNEQKRLKGKPKYDPNQKSVRDINEIMHTLPHRFPFVLVDKIIELSENHVVGIKNVTADEYFFQGHFPENPIFPGVLQLEALAQTGGILALSTVEDPENWDTYFLKVDKARFKHKVVPGDTLILRMKLINPIRRGICHMQGHAYVGNKLVSEGDMTAQIIKREQ